MIALIILAGIVGAVAGAFGVGLGAAKALEAAHGAREGAAAMSGFFFFGPFGAVAGALLGVGLALHLAGRSAAWARGLMIAAAIVIVLGGILFSMVAAPDSRPYYPHVLEFELEVPAEAVAGIDVPGPNALWGAAGADLSDEPTSQFIEKNCQGDVCLLTGSIAPVGPLNNFRVAAHLGAKQYRFLLDLPPAVTGAIDWSAWRTSDDARLRWRVVDR